MHTYFMRLMALAAFLFWNLISLGATTYRLSDFGVIPDTGADMSKKMAAAILKIKSQTRKGEHIILSLRPGVYDFYPDSCTNKTLFISNHDQDNPKNIGILLDGWENLTFDGNGARLLFHGRMLPVVLTGSSGCTLRNLSIDFPNPHIAQVEIIGSDSNDGTTFRISPEVKCRIDGSGRLETYGRGWTLNPRMGIAFNPESGHILYNTGDLWCPTDSIIRIDSRTFRAPHWYDKRLSAGTIVALRDGERPTPGIFLYEDANTLIENVDVHYAEGMGVLAQTCTDITLRDFRVSIPEGSGRYFTTQADATHFSGCKGLISSTGGLYEGMMDDAINVHGTYLRAVRRIGADTLQASYMHPQTYGFTWGHAGDTVQIISSRTMEIVGEKNTIKSIRPIDRKTADGAKTFEIVFENPLPQQVRDGGAFGIENLTWTPKVVFSDNIVRNNRARGALFSTPRRTVVENNLFDHTSGSAILLCGDCNGWYETGACRDVQIRGNRFINSLTSLYQFTEAVISIHPVIPDIDAQQTPFHGGPDVPGVIIEKNEFHSFDYPIVYAKSIDGLTIRGNRIVRTDSFAPFHKNSNHYNFIKVKNIEID
mgnify:CR=1 FL=1